ncbi:MAG: RagB/SusD family nutrient uptake outer membrane protein [Dysgonamonadaceae bacterium]|jgi:hypothetical protein|nr:RagB/SusD family nutrient uptake outer membrane protein [Dysgonamonadaceae bacterium]
MKIIKYLISALYIFLLCFVAGCVDLDYSEVTTDDEAWVYASPTNGIQRLVTDIYAQIPFDFGYFDGAMLSSASDESDYARSLSNIHKFYNGAWSTINPFDSTWRNSYSAIAEANIFLEKIGKISLDEYKYSGIAYDIMKAKFEKFPYEVRFLRAYFYFELAKTYGDVPLVTKSLTAEEANNVSRTPVKDVFQFIVDECDAIAQYLPITYAAEPSQETGRASRPMALALKARTLLYAASPLFNPSNDAELWHKAAAANKAVLDNAATWGISLGAYSALWGDQSFLNPEIFFIRPAGNSQEDSGWGNNFERYNFPVGVENGNSGNCPTQSLVDAYEYKSTGISFGDTWNGSVNVTAENPYSGLDPRFGLTVVKNGDSWPVYNSLPIETFEGGLNASPLYGATTTGYYLKKYCDQGVYITTNYTTAARHSWIVFRLSEFYLNYAEAVYNYLKNADATNAEFSLSANAAINVLRDRPDVMMPHFSGNGNFTERYTRERMVELAFEGHRFWDVRRWKKGNDFFTNVKVAKITKDGSGNVILQRDVKTRLWDEKYNLFPIPFTEMQKNHNLTQNAGW